MKYCCMLWVKCTVASGCARNIVAWAVPFLLRMKKTSITRSHVVVESFIYVVYLFRNDSLYMAFRIEFH